MGFSQTANTPGASASRLNRRVTIQQESSTGDGQGGKKNVTWTDLLTRIPAEIVHFAPNRNGDEKFIAQQLYASHMILVRIRYRASVNINAGMRLLYQNRTYRIRAAYVPDEALNSIFLECEEIQTKGTNPQ